MNPNLQLSTFEEELMNNKEWILTKNIIIKKAQQLLAIVHENMVAYTEADRRRIPAEVLSVSGKVSKGENYLGLPWLMLDYPRYFDKENVFAIRTMFWWGNFFSITLHLSGKYKNSHSQFITNHFNELVENEFYSCIREDPWHHHFEKDNFRAVRNFSAGEFSDHLQHSAFIKLAKKFPLTIWNAAPQILSEEFVRITNWLD
jgi:hypothetical protein